MTILYRRNLLISISLAFLALSASQCTSTSPDKMDAGTQNAPDKHLFLALDGVPYDMILRLWEKNRLEGFQKPTKIVATFPSLTPSGFTAALGAKNTKGYEDIYFNWDSKKLEGGFKEYFFNQEGPENQGRFLTLFDFHISRFHDVYAYAIPILAVNKEYDEFVEDKELAKFLSPENKKKLFKAYLVYTDPVAHMMGKPYLRKYLNKLAKLLNSFRANYPGQLDITIISDHGNHFMRKFKRVDVSDPIEDAGFEVRDNLIGENSVVIPKFGLVAYVGIFSNKSVVKKVAKIASISEGVDITTYQNLNDVKKFTVYKNAGSQEPVESEISLRITPEKMLIRYEPVSGDALEYMKIVQKLRAKFPKIEDNYFPEKNWFEQTYDHKYPDALLRIIQGHTQYVDHPASILVSLKDGYYAGQKIMSLMGAQTGTHGSLTKGGSITFLISTREGAPHSAPIREIPSIIRNNLNLPFILENTSSLERKHHVHSSFH